MDLYIKERLYIPAILKAENNFMEFNLKKSILKKIAISDDEKKDFNIQEDTKSKSIKWDAQKDAESPLIVDFTKEELEYLKKCCEVIAEAPYPDEFWACVEKLYNAGN